MPIRLSFVVVVVGMHSIRVFMPIIAIWPSPVDATNAASTNKAALAGAN